MDTKKIKTINFQYILASIFMLILVVSDLVFDFILDFNGSDYVSFVFTLGASVIVFFVTYDIHRVETKIEYEKISTFVKGNFNHWQVIFSILDIFCGLISILAGLVIIGGIFKIVKIIYIPIKCLTVTNKSKTVVKSITKFSLIWTISRLFIKKKGGEKMLTWIKNNKITLAYCIVLGLLAGFAGYVLPLHFCGTPIWANILIAIASVIITVILVLILGNDKVKQAVFRMASYALSEDNYKKVTETINLLLEEQELEQIAKQELEQEAKEEEANTESTSETEKRAKIDAIKEQLKAQNTNE